MSKRITTTGRIRGTTPEQDAAAKDLRRRMTQAERRLWAMLRNHQLDGHGFRRQHPQGSFVIDFACPARLLAIEVDGGIHAGQVAQDEARTEILEEWGWKLVRFSNQQIIHDLAGVLTEITRLLAERPLAPGQRHDQHAGANLD